MMIVPFVSADVGSSVLHSDYAEQVANFSGVNLTDGQTNVTVVSVLTKLPQSWLEVFETYVGVQTTGRGNDVSYIFMDRVVTRSFAQALRRAAYLLSFKNDMYQAQIQWLGFETPDLCKRFNSNNYVGLYYNFTSGGWDEVWGDPSCQP